VPGDPIRVAKDGLIMHIIVVLVTGLIVGAIARAIVPGTEPGGWLVSLILGVGGSILGGMIGKALGMYHAGQGAGIIMSLIGAIVLVAIYHAIMARRGPPHGHHPV
jgi:uncharacterized membrane protein YeaQ/YmgE (transglycosylase-associated protein family)